MSWNEVFLVDVVSVAEFDLVPAGGVPAFVAEHPRVEQSDHLHVQREQHGDVRPTKGRCTSIQRSQINDDQLWRSYGPDDARAARCAQPGGALGRVKHRSIKRSTPSLIGPRKSQSGPWGSN